MRRRRAHELQSFSVCLSSFIFVIGEKITKVFEATKEDEDTAVEAGQEAYETHGGLNASLRECSIDSVMETC